MPRDGTLLGALFESLVTLSVRVYAQPVGARVGHLRTHRGEHEIDLIVEREDGRALAIEASWAAPLKTTPSGTCGGCEAARRRPPGRGRRHDR